MRVPWFIYIPVLLLSVVITWSWRTKNMNFFPPKKDSPIPLPKPEPNSEISGPPKPAPVEIKEEPEYIVQSITAYQELQNNEEQLRRLFSILRADGEDEKAYLVGERLLESKTLPIKEKSEISKKMALLLTTIEPWIFDINEMHSLKITINGASANQTIRDSISKELTEIIEISSGGYVIPSVTYNEAGTSTLSVSLGKISTEEEIESSESLEHIGAGIYRVLNSNLNNIGSEISLPYWHTPTFNEVKVGFTRRAWKELINSSIPEPEITAPEELQDEDAE